MARNFLMWPVLLVLFSGCASTQVKTGHEELSLDQHLPLRLAVAMNPEDLALQEHHSYNARFYFETFSWTQEGKLVQAAALTAFAPMVEQVLPHEEMLMPDLIIKVRGNSIFNPGMQYFYADVTATGYLPNGEVVGTFQAESVAKGVLAFHEQALEGAYVAAFQDIGRQFLESGAMNRAMIQRDKVKR